MISEAILPERPIKLGMPEAYSDGEMEYNMSYDLSVWQSRLRVAE